MQNDDLALDLVLRLIVIWSPTAAGHALENTQSAERRVRFQYQSRYTVKQKCHALF